MRDFQKETKVINLTLSLEHDCMRHILKVSKHLLPDPLNSYQKFTFAVRQTLLSRMQIYRIRWKLAGNVLYLFAFSITRLMGKQEKTVTNCITFFLKATDGERWYIIYSSHCNTRFFRVHWSVRSSNFLSRIFSHLNGFTVENGTTRNWNEPQWLHQFSLSIRCIRMRVTVTVSV